MIRAITCCDLDGVIGLGGKIAYSFKQDIDQFKMHTSGGLCVFGRKSWAEMPASFALTRNIVILSRDLSIKIDGVSIASLESWFDLAEYMRGIGNCWICGGDYTYKTNLHLCDEVWVTRVDNRIQSTEHLSKFPIDVLEHDFDVVYSSNSTNQFDRMSKRQMPISYQRWVRKNGTKPLGVSVPRPIE